LEQVPFVVVGTVVVRTGVIVVDTVEATVEVEDVVIMVEATLVVLGLTPTLVVVTIEGVTDGVPPGGLVEVMLSFVGVDEGRVVKEVLSADVVTGVLLTTLVSAGVVKGVTNSVEVVPRVVLTRVVDNGVLPPVGGWTVVLVTSKVVDELASTVVPTGVVVATGVGDDVLVSGEELMEELLVRLGDDRMFPSAVAVKAVVVPSEAIGKELGSVEDEKGTVVSKGELKAEVRKVDVLVDSVLLPVVRMEVLHTSSV
jgi:hypothetical protein